MSLPQFNEVISLSNNELSDAIIKTEKELFNLRFKKATRQSFKSHEIKYAKRRLAQLKTILTVRLNSLEYKQNNLLVKLAKKNYIPEIE
jgi:large subunit ribosomal protein L29